MTPEVQARCEAALLRWEGNPNYWYRDREGCSIGVGLDAFTKQDAARFGPGAVDAWELIIPMRPDMSLAQYAIACSWRADPTLLKHLFEQKIASDEAALRAQLPAWDTYRAEAQIALIDLAWQDGPDLTGWPHMRSAILAGDWTTAAAESATSIEKGGSLLRNAARRDLLASCAQIAV
jgi:GH24 family phage-related lysozyme (muramidase)